MQGAEVVNSFAWDVRVDLEEVYLLVRCCESPIYPLMNRN